MASTIILVVRLLQLIFAIIVLGVIAYVISLYISSPSQFNFLLFCGVWTIFPVLPYLTLTVRYWPTAAHKFVVVAFESATMIFWFAGFIAAAVYVDDFYSGCASSGCSSAKAGVVFGAFEWLLFAATTTMAVVHVVKTRGEGGPSGATAANVQQQYVASTMA